MDSPLNEILKPCLAGVGLVQELIAHLVGNDYPNWKRSEILRLVQLLTVASTSGISFALAHKYSTDPWLAIALSTTVGYASCQILQKGQELCVPGTKYFPRGNLI